MKISKPLTAVLAALILHCAAIAHAGTAGELAKVFARNNKALQALQASGASGSFSFDVNVDMHLHVVVPFGQQYPAPNPPAASAAKPKSEDTQTSNDFNEEIPARKFKKIAPGRQKLIPQKKG